MSVASRAKLGIYLDLGEYPSDYAAATTYQRPEGHRWTDLQAKAQHAEALGFDSIWIPDHLIFSNGDGKVEGFWECTSVLAALAASTSRVEIGSLVACTPFRNPAVLAKIASTVDEISDGRLILGLGAGYYEPEFEAFGYPTGKLASRFEEAIQIISGLLREGAVDFNGEFYSARECELRPRGPRRKGPPLMIAARGPKMMRLAARYGDLWNEVFVNAEPDHLTRYHELSSRLDRACADMHRDSSTIGRSVAVFVKVTKSRDNGQWRQDGQLVSGSCEAITRFLSQLADAGVCHIIVAPAPQSLDGIKALGPIVKSFEQT